MEPSVSGAATFTALFARCVLTLHAALRATNGPSEHALQQLTTDCLRYDVMYITIKYIYQLIDYDQI